MQRYFKFNILLNCLIVLLILTSCKKENNETPATTQNIDEVINSNPEFSLFAYAAQKTKLDVFTKGVGPYTFFIPNNAAFAALGINSTADIDKLNTLFLIQLVTYHFQDIYRTYYEIPQGPNTSMSSHSNIVQYASRYVTTDKAYINGVEVLDKGTKASNGIYYTVAEVIYPPYYSNSLLMMEAMGGYNLMLQAITKLSATTSFTTSPATVFGIPNTVMLANGYDSTTIANLSGASATTLTNVLRYHVLPQRIFKSDFKAGNITTRFTSNSVVVGGSLGAFTIRGKNNAATQPISRGFANGAGVLYSVSEMLKP
jgi:uncharacterized surface protein with fasciclin (FAS1) repeats